MATTSAGPPSTTVGGPPTAPGEPVAPVARARGPRPAAALLVLAIAVVIVVGGVVASAFLSGGTPVTSLRSVTIPDGTTVPLTPGDRSLRSIVSAGQPPADILGNLVVPTAATYLRTVDNSGGTSSFDETVSWTTGLAQTQVTDTFTTALPKLGWQVIYTGPARGKAGREVLAKHGSGDGYYWEVGVVASPTTSAGTTPFSLELFQLSDDDS